MNMAVDKGASVIAHLKNKAKETGRPLQLYLQLFCQEEFLRRLSASRYAENFVLKGGLLIYAITEFKSRPTIDIDFLLQNLSSDVERIREIIEAIFQTGTGNDFISFKSEGYEAISAHRKYAGISFRMVGCINNTRTRFNVDIGVGDIIIPSAKQLAIPVQLPGFSTPIVTVYSLESTIAEKFDAILSRLELTSRMKDFYDIYYLSHFYDFDGRVLQEAIYETIQNRGTDYRVGSLGHIARFAKDDTMRGRWNRFLKIANLPEIGFEEIMGDIEVFLLPVWEAIVLEGECFGN